MTYNQAADIVCTAAAELAATLGISEDSNLAEAISIIRPGRVTYE